MELRDACRPHGPHFPSPQNHGFGVTPSDPARWCSPESGRTLPTSAVGQFVPIAVGSLNGDMVVRAAFGSYIDPAYQQQWAVENIVSIRNHRLDKEYRARSQEMLFQRNQFRSPMARQGPHNDLLMFSCVRTDEELQRIADGGYFVRSTSSNYLGDGMKGVTLSCHADVHLKVAQLVVKHTCWMIISKVVLGNRRKITEVREGAVDVSPVYDCHVFAVGPHVSQTLSEQAIRNQAFFFEFDGAGNTSPRPRQILPFQAIKFRNVDSVSPRLTAGDSLHVPLAVVQPTQATQQNQETSDAIQSTTPASCSNLPSVAQCGLPTTRLPFEHAALDNQMRSNEMQQNSVSVMLGIQSLLNHMTVESGLGNEPIQTAVLSGIQNQLNSLAVRSGLDNRQNYLALLSGLQSQLTYLFVQSGLQSQNALRPESAPQSRKGMNETHSSHTALVDQCTPSPQAGDVNHDPGLTIRPCNKLSVLDLPCNMFAPQTSMSRDRTFATPCEEVSSSPEFGMRLSIVAPPGATDGEPAMPDPECFQPIVIKPETSPSFLRAPLTHEQQDSASVCTRDVEPANAPGFLWEPPVHEQQDTASVCTWEVVPANTPGFLWEPPVHVQQDGASVRTREVEPANAPGFLWEPPAHVQHHCLRTQNPLLLNLIRGNKDAKRVPEPHLPGPPPALIKLPNGDTSVDQTACSETVAEDHGPTSTDPSDVILGTVSEVVPSGSPCTRVEKTFDEVLDGLLKDVAALSSACCDISSGMKRKSSSVSVEVAAELDASNAGNDRDVSRIYVHDDGCLELVIERLTSDDEDSATDDDPFECSFESYNDRINWRNFLHDERFQPSVMLDRLDIVYNDRDISQKHH